jgi:NADH-quinone oxidoreductase subunit J
MTALEIVFLLIAAATLISAVMVVSARRIMHAALWLIVTLLGVAALFATLESGFFAVVQVIVYIGAIAILIIFALMLTRRNDQEQGEENHRYAWLSALASLAVTGVLIATLSGWQAFTSARMAISPENVDNIAAIGKALVSPDAYAIPFEVASVLLIGALIGAIYVANEQKKQGEGDK